MKQYSYSYNLVVLVGHVTCMYTCMVIEQHVLNSAAITLHVNLTTSEI